MVAPQRFETQLFARDLDPKRPKLLETPWGTMALFLIEGEVLCAAAFCPHLEGPLFEGTLSGATITCPWHQWRYDLRSGQRIALMGVPLPGEKLARCRVEHDARGAIVLCAPEAT
jgi:nitrite reductase/ring-hydroxylating ferredoxin subunit